MRRLIGYWNGAQGPISISDKTPHSKISQSLEAAKFVFRNCPIALKFDRHLGSRAAEVPVKFQSDAIIWTTNLVALRLHEILQ